MIRKLDGHCVTSGRGEQGKLNWLEKDINAKTIRSYACDLATCPASQQYFETQRLVPWNQITLTKGQVPKICLSAHLIHWLWSFPTVQRETLHAGLAFLLLDISQCCWMDSPTHLDVLSPLSSTPVQLSHPSLQHWYHWVGQRPLCTCWQLPDLQRCDIPPPRSLVPALCLLFTASPFDRWSSSQTLLYKSFSDVLINFDILLIR